MVEARAAEASGRFGLEDDVGHRGQPARTARPAAGASRSSTTPRFQVVVPPPQAALGVGPVVHERLDGAGRVATGRLDQHDLGAQVGQQLARVGRMLAGQLDHLETGERARAWRAVPVETVAAGSPSQDAPRRAARPAHRT